MKIVNIEAFPIRVKNDFDIGRKADTKNINTAMLEVKDLEKRKVNTAKKYNQVEKRNLEPKSLGNYETYIKDMGEYYVDEGSATSIYSKSHETTVVKIETETGIIGFVFLIGLFILNVKKLTHIFYSQIASRKSLISSYQKCILISFFISLFPIMPSTSIFNNWMNVIYYLPVGFYLYFNNLRNHKIRLKDKS